MSYRFKSLTLMLGMGAALGYGTAQAQTPPPATATTNLSSLLSRVPNLTPFRLGATSPLLRKINPLTARSTMVNSAFCTGLGDNEEREVAVPDFEWGVANDNRSAINTPFSVTLSGTPVSVSAIGVSAPNTVLSTQQVASIPMLNRRTFKNWSGRPARIRVVKVTGEPLIGEYQNSAGCYLPNPASSMVILSSVALDPKPLIIRVDSASQIKESMETDNDLTIN